MITGLFTNERALPQNNQYVAVIAQGMTAARSSLSLVRYLLGQLENRMWLGMPESEHISTECDHVPAQGELSRSNCEGNEASLYILQMS